MSHIPPDRINIPERLLTKVNIPVDDYDKIYGDHPASNRFGGSSNSSNWSNEPSSRPVDLPSTVGSVDYQEHFRSGQLRPGDITRSIDGSEKVVSVDVDPSIDGYIPPTNDPGYLGPSGLDLISDAHSEVNMHGFLPGGDYIRELDDPHYSATTQRTVNPKNIPEKVNGRMFETIRTGQFPRRIWGVPSLGVLLLSTVVLPAVSKCRT